MVKAGRGEWGKGLAGEAIAYRISDITLCLSPQAFPACPVGSENRTGVKFGDYFTGAQRSSSLPRLPS